jgi:hypothetical protein
MNLGPNGWLPSARAAVAVNAPPASSSIAAESPRARPHFAIPRLVAKATVARQLMTLPPSRTTANFELFDALMTVSSR